jgi:hypothetical protein
MQGDLLHDPTGDAALLRDLRPLQSIVFIFPRLHLQRCKEVEGGKIGGNVTRRDLSQDFLGRRVSRWGPFSEFELAAKLLVELTKRSETRTLPSVGLCEIVLRREPEVMGSALGNAASQEMNFAVAE